MKCPILISIILTLTACGSRFYPLEALSKERPTVLVFLATECPISQKYVRGINQLAAKYPQVQFRAVFPSKETASAIREFKSAHQLEIPVIHDADNTLLRAMGATHTPQAFFLSADKKILYQGAIDNWYYDLEQLHQEPTDHFLQKALDSYALGKPIYLKDTRPVGCRIEQ